MHIELVASTAAATAMQVVLTYFYLTFHHKNYMDFVVRCLFILVSRHESIVHYKEKNATTTTATLATYR